MTDFTEPEERARINAGIRRSYVEDADATIVSSGENTSSEQVLVDEVAGTGAISHDRDAHNSGNGIVRSN